MQHDSSPPTRGKVLLGMMVALEWFALPVQFYLLITSGRFTLAEALVRFFSFFTVLTNSTVAVCCTILLFSRPARAYAFFARCTTLTAITVYILIVGIVYNVVLRPLQHLEGLHSVTTEVFHTVVPFLFLLYWLFFTPKQHIAWKNLLVWQVYPLLYVVYTFAHGKYTHFYPYPFIDITELGFSKAMTNGLFVLIGFVVLSCILVAIGNRRAKV